MIRFEALSKVFTMAGQRKVLVENANLELKGGASVALLGRNGAGKSTLLRMIAGTVEPTSGRIVSSGTISWPVGFAGSFHSELTGIQNTRFIARVYGIDTDELVDFVEDFAGLGVHFRLPLKTYSSGMKSRLAFGVSMGIPFDTYLVDEVTSVGDAAFRIRSAEVFKQRMQTSGAIVISHSMNMVRQLCTSAIVLENGKMVYFDDLEDAIIHHELNMLR